MIRFRAMMLAILLLAGAAMTAWCQSRNAEEQPLQDEKIFQQLLADYHLLARLLIQQNRSLEGIPILKTVYELSFRPSPLALELCDVLEKAGLPAETIEILREQMNREPLNEEWSTRLIAACERSNRWEEAVQRRLDRRKKHPGDLQNLAGLAEAYRRLGKEKEAVELVDKIAITARDKLFIFEKPPSAAPDPHQEKIDADGFIALRLQRQLDLQDDFEQYAAAFVLRQRKAEPLDAVLQWLREKPPAAYLKSVFPDQLAVGLWLEGRLPEAAATLEKKFPARQYPGADRLLFRYYTHHKKPEKIQARFGKELPDYLRDEKNQGPAGPARDPAAGPNQPSAEPAKENPDGDVGEAEDTNAP